MGENFWPKFRPWVFLLAILLLSGWILTRPLDLPRLRQEAREDVLNDYRQQVEEQLLREGIAADEARFQSARAVRERESQSDFRRAVEERLDIYRGTFSDAEGMYLLHIDPYGHLHQAKNLERYGMVGNHGPFVQQYAYGTRPSWKDPRKWMGIAEIAEIVQEEPQRIQRNKIAAVPIPETFDTLRSPPDSVALKPTLLPYLLYGLRALNIELRMAAQFLPVALGLLTIVLVFFIIRILSNDYGAFFGTLLLVIHPAFFATAEVGYTDTNSLIILHMVLIAAIVILLLRTSRFIPAILLSIALGIVFWSFAFAWSGVMVMAAVLLVFVGLLCLSLLWSSGKKYMFGGVLTALAITALIVVRGPQLRRAFEYLGLTQGNILPNPYLLIAELGQFSWPLFFRVLGGFPMLIIIGAAIIFLVLQLQSSSDRISLLFLLSWLTIMAAGALRIRFFIFFLLPLSIIIGIALGAYLVRLPNAIAERRTKGILGNAKTVRAGLSIFIAGLMTLLFVPNLHAEIQAAVPMLNSAIAQTATQLQSGTKFLNPWWDSGYFYLALAEQPTLSDGAFPNDLRSYWLAEAYRETDPRRAMRILQMLDCGGATAIANIAPDPGEGKQIVDELLIADQQSFEKRLAGIVPHIPPNEFLNPEEQEQRLNRTREQFRCSAPKAYLILSEDLLLKTTVFESFGQATLNGELPDFKPQFAEPALPCNRIGRLLHCGLYTVDLSAMTAEQGGKKISVVTKPDGSAQGLPPAGESGLMLYRDAQRGGYHAIVFHPQFFQTMLARLYFGDPELDAYFEPFSDFHGPYSGRVVTYRIAWEKL